MLVLRPDRLLGLGKARVRECADGDADEVGHPLDFQRFVAGVGYKYSSYLRLALDVQYLAYLHSQFTFPLSEGKEFGLTSPVKDAVPPDILAVFLNVEFNY